jgi:hypothetical protein
MVVSVLKNKQKRVIGSLVGREDGWSSVTARSYLLITKVALNSYFNTNRRRKRARLETGVIKMTNIHPVTHCVITPTNIHSQLIPIAFILLLLPWSHEEPALPNTVSSLVME